MKINKFSRNILYGFLAWLVPFLASFPFFFSADGGLIIELMFFKTIMIVVGSITVAFLLASYFKKIDSHYLREGLLVGAVWFGISIVLDLVILVPISGQSLPDYFMQIGLRYLVMPIMSIMMGILLQEKTAI